MGASATSRLSNKDYSIIVIYATENEKVLDLTTKNNVKCYTWSLLKRLSAATSQYTPTNKMRRLNKLNLNFLLINKLIIVRCAISHQINRTKTNLKNTLLYLVQ